MIYNYITTGFTGITNGITRNRKATIIENFNNFRKMLHKTPKLRVEEANLLRLTRQQKSITNGINSVSSSPSSSFIYHILDRNNNKNNESQAKSSPIIRQRKNAAVIVPLTDDFNMVHKDYNLIHSDKYKKNKDEQNGAIIAANNVNNNNNNVNVNYENTKIKKVTYKDMTTTDDTVDDDGDDGKDKDKEIQSEDSSDDDNDSLNSASSLRNNINIQAKPSYNRMKNYMIDPTTSATSPSSSPKAKGINRYHIASFDDSYDEGIDINTVTTATTLTSSTAANLSTFSMKIVEEDDEDNDDDSEESDDHINNDGATLNLNTVHPSTTTTTTTSNQTNMINHHDNNGNNISTNIISSISSSNRESSPQPTINRLSSTRTKDGSFLSNITEIRLNIQVDYYYYTIDLLILTVVDLWCKSHYCLVYFDVMYYLYRFIHYI